ncbi:MAG: glycoside hydrolase family 27 protein [Planctomycetes bacterium]|nr:glycoside hydrolase family 27 protein [Planctomycetota bacterium]
MKNAMLIVLVVILTVLCGCGAVQSTSSKGKVELSPSPPMGWNSWNWWGKQAINEEIVHDTIDAMADSGLADAGYEYVVVDGGWRDVELSPDGKLQAHPTKFPNGIKPLADHAHARGLKFGLHTVPGSHDCGGDRVGAWGIEEVHINQFVEWGVDFIKLDKCRFVLPNDDQTVKGNFKKGWEVEGNIENSYAKWRKLLDKSGRDVVLSASAYMYYDWYPKLTQMGRTTGDIVSRQSGGAVFDGPTTRHHSVMDIVEQNNEVAVHAGNGYWNDPDMMVTGDQGLTQEQQKAHFTLWCIMSSPLMLGNDPIAMSSDELDIITNERAIAVNQDPTEQGKRIIDNGNAEVWAKKLKNGDVAVMLLNRSKQSWRNVSFNLSRIGLSGERQIYDIWREKDIGTFDGEVTLRVQPTACRFVIIAN